MSKKVWEEIYPDASAMDIIDSIKNLGTTVLDFDEESIHTIKVKLKRKQRLYILFLGDLHIGHNDFSHNYLTKVLTIAKQIIDRGEKLLIIGMGDYIETDKDFASRYMIENVNMRTKKQFEALLQYIQPFKDNFVMAIWGNHEERLLRDLKTLRVLAMIDKENLLEEILHKLSSNIIVGKPQRGLCLTIEIERGTRKQKYSIRILHGKYGGYARPELQFQREANNYPMDSLIAMGHTHQKFWKDKVRFLTFGGKRVIIKQCWLNTGTSLKMPAYAASKSYPANVMALPFIELHSDVQHIELCTSPKYDPRFIMSAGLLPLKPLKKGLSLSNLFKVKRFVVGTNSKANESGIVGT